MLRPSSPTQTGAGPDISAAAVRPLSSKTVGAAVASGRTGPVGIGRGIGSAGLSAAVRVSSDGGGKGLVGTAVGAATARPLDRTTVDAGAGGAEPGAEPRR